MSVCYVYMPLNLLYSAHTITVYLGMHLNEMYNQTSLHPSPNAIVYLRMSEWILANRVFSLPWIKLWVDFFIVVHLHPHYNFTAFPFCNRIDLTLTLARRHSRDWKWKTIPYEKSLTSKTPREMNDGRNSVSLPSPLPVLLGSCIAECSWTAARVVTAHVPLKTPLKVKFILYQKMARSFITYLNCARKRWRSWGTKSSKKTTSPPRPIRRALTFNCHSTHSLDATEYNLLKSTKTYPPNSDPPSTHTLSWHYFNSNATPHLSDSSSHAEHQRGTYIQ